MEIEDFVKGLRDSFRKKQPTSEQVQKLVDIVNTYPCHSDAILLLIRIVWDYQYPGVTIFQWEGYYKKALEENPECWANQDLIELYTLGSELYTYEEKDELAAESALSAYNLSPNAWDLLNN